MRHILITPQMKLRAKAYAEKLFSGRNAHFETPDARLNKLISGLMLQDGAEEYVLYVQKIKRLRKNLNRITPDRYKYVKDKHFANIDDDHLKKKFTFGKETKSFPDWIVWAMRYEDVRDEPYLMEHFRKEDIKTCVYCNAQFAVTVDESSGKYIANYELDHNVPKSIYPFLCTNFFNLVPCCGQCNKNKSDKDLKFKLYTKEGENLDEFVFSLDDAHLGEYLTTFQRDNIIVEFNGRNARAQEVSEKFNEELHIEDLYNEHKDVVEELLWKYVIYNPSYLNALSSQFNKGFLGNGDFKRFILGSYYSPKDVFRRPLAKLIQDISEQIGLAKRFDEEVLAE